MEDKGKDKDERRYREVSVPYDYSDYMTLEQKVTLNSVRNFGWQIAFIRRRLVEQPSVILKNSANSYAQLLDDGSIDYQPDIIIRK